MKVRDSLSQREAWPTPALWVLYHWFRVDPPKARNSFESGVSFVSVPKASRALLSGRLSVDHKGPCLYLSDPFQHNLPCQPGCNNDNVDVQDPAPVEPQSKPG